MEAGFWSIDCQHIFSHNIVGGTTGTWVSRYEHFERAPSLDTALAFEAVFKRSASELFGGLYQQAEREVTERAQSLLAKLEGQPGIRAQRKRQALAELAGISSDESSV